MRKGIGRAQQIRGQKRRTKVLNRRLNRNPSDISNYAGDYDKWYREKLASENNEVSQDSEKTQA